MPKTAEQSKARRSRAPARSAATRAAAPVGRAGRARRGAASGRRARGRCSSPPRSSGSSASLPPRARRWPRSRRAPRSIRSPTCSTGAASSASSSARCAYVKRYGTSAALIYLDLDGFKRINDRHGHAAGDAVLKAVAMVLDRHVRASDLVARLGGDEFALLLWNCAEADAHAKAQAHRSGDRAHHRDPCRRDAVGRRLGGRDDAAAARSAGGRCSSAPTAPCMPARRAQRAMRRAVRTLAAAPRRFTATGTMCHIRNEPECGLSARHELLPMEDL